SEVAPGFLPFVSATPNVCSAVLLDPTFGLCSEALGESAPLVLDDGTPLGTSFTSVPSGYRGPSLDGGAALVKLAGQYNLNPAAASATLVQALKTDSIGLNIRQNIGARVDVFLDMYGDRSSNSSKLAAAAFVPILADSPSNPFQQDIVVS